MKLLYNLATILTIIVCGAIIIWFGFRSINRYITYNDAKTRYEQELATIEKIKQYCAPRLAERAKQREELRLNPKLPSLPLDDCDGQRPTPVKPTLNLF